MLGESATTARLAGAGYDWLLLDGQHGVFDRSRVIEVLRHRRESWSRVLVRVPRLDAADIGAALDADADGIVVPLVDSASDARAAVHAALYPPAGGRSWGPIAPFWGRDAPEPAVANQRIEVWVMIETSGALDELEEILAVPGVTSAFVGPNDLALALGMTVDELLADSRDDSPLARIRAVSRAAGIRCGAYAAAPAMAARFAELGYDDLAVATDVDALDAGAAVLLNGGESADRPPGAY